MECIIAKKGGILVAKEWEYDEKKGEGEYAYYDLSPEYILRWLSYSVELEDGFTVRDWFQIVENYPKLQELDGFMQDYISEYSKCPPSGCVNEKYKDFSIFFKKGVSTSNWDNDNLECDITIHVFAAKSDDDPNVYGIEFWPLEESLDMPMKFLDGEIAEENWYNDFEGKKRMGAKLSPRWVKVTYTLFDFITSYIYEISFFGLPGERKEKMEELEDMCRKIDAREVELKQWNGIGADGELL